MGTVTHSYEYNAICDVCGFKFKASELKKRWDGWMVCSTDFEHRHPMDFYRVRDDNHPLPWIRPEVGVPTMANLDSYDSTVYVCTPARRRPVISAATVGCATLGRYP